MNRLRQPFAVLLLFCCLMQQATVSFAQTFETVSQDDLTALEEALAQEPNLGDEARTQLTSQLEIAKQSLREAAGNLSQAKDLEVSAAAAPADLERMQQALEVARREALDPASVIPDESSPEQLESEISLLEATRLGLVQRRDELRASFEGWPQQREEIQQQLAELKRRVIDGVGAPAEPADSLEQQVAYAVSRARMQAFAAEQEALEAELATRAARP